MRHLLNRRHFLAYASAAVSLLALPATRGAAQTPVATPEAHEAPRFAIIPTGEAPAGYPEIDLAPNEQGDIHVGVVVEGTVSTDLTIYRADTIPAANGGFAAAELDDEPEGHTLWMDLEPTEFAASPGNTYEFTVPVNVPEDADPGQYVSALVVQTNPLGIPGSPTFNQIIRSALSVVINVPGEITPGMDVGDPEIVIQGGIRFIRIPVANTGNILIRPEGTVTVTTPDGNPILTAPVAMNSIYLGLENEIRIVIPDQVPEGDYLISYDLSEPTHDLHASMADVPVTVEDSAPEVTPESAAFSIDSATVTPNGDPIQFADVELAITNNERDIPTARISLVAIRDGEEIETYDLASSQAIPQGTSTVSQRYIPASGWEPGTWTFRILVAAVDASSTETILAEVDAQDEIVVR